MKKIILVFGILFLISFVSADLCRGSDGYYHDCGSSYVDLDSGKKIIIDYESEWEDESDRYNQCLKDCDYKYKKYCGSYSKNERCSLREECYDSCTERKSYFEKVEYVEKIEDKREYYKESYEYKTEIKDETSDLWNENNYEVIYLDKREYEYEKPYLTRDSAVVYINPHRDSEYYQDDIIYLDYEDNYNRAGYGYKQSDYSSWRYKEPYVWNDYQQCKCEEWNRGKCQEWECDDSWNNYYYEPRQSFNKGFEWRW